MTKEEIRQKTIDITISLMGGWDKIYNDIEIGIKNGYSEEFQFELLGKLLNDG